MKALENLIEFINSKIENLILTIKGATPQIFFDAIEFIKHLPQTIKHKINALIPKVRIFFLKLIGYTQHYITLLRGLLTSLFIYLRSEEFKHDKKKALITNPINYIKNNPIKIIATTSISVVFIFSLGIISMDARRIIKATKAAREPASNEIAEVIDNTIFEIKDHKFEVKIGAATGGHGEGHGAEGSHEEEILKADLKIKVANENKIELLEEMEEMMDDYLEAMEITVPNLPLLPEEKQKLEGQILKTLNEGFQTHTKEMPIVSVELIISQHARPAYYRQEERMFKLENTDLQVFLEDTKRNHQVYIDFTVLASNRNIILFLKDHEMLIRDRLSTNVEPILPHLPIEDEGKRIMKDKVRDEINDTLKKENIEGRILDVYIDYVISS